MTVGPRSGKLREAVPTTIVVHGTYESHGLLAHVANAAELTEFLRAYGEQAASALEAEPPRLDALPDGHVAFETFGDVDVYDENFRLAGAQLPWPGVPVRARLQPWARKHDGRVVLTLVLRALRLESSGGSP